MERKVLVFVANEAVAGIAVTVIEQLGAQVIVSTEAREALARIRSQQPQLVLCGDDIEQLDCIDLTAAIRNDPALKNVPVLLIFSGDCPPEKELEARDIGASAVVFRPFKSGRLRELAAELLESSGTDSESTDAHGTPTTKESTSPKQTELSENLQQQLPTALLVSNPMRRMAIEKMLSRRNAECRIFEDPEALKTASKDTPFAATFLDWDEIKQTTWSHSKTMGRLVIINIHQEQAQSLKLPKDVLTADRPLSVEKLRQTLSEIYPEVPLYPETDQDALAPGEQAQLAARISAAIYDLLLKQDTLRNRRWDEACTQAAAEALRICRRFQT